MVDSLRGRRVVVTGGAGFLGRPVCQQLEKFGPADIFVPTTSTVAMVPELAGDVLHKREAKFRQAVRRPPRARRCW